MHGLPPPRPIPIKERAAILFLERGQLDVIDGAFVLVDANGVRTVIPVGGFVCLMLEPGTRVSHMAVVLAARAGTLLIWVGEAGGAALRRRPAGRGAGGPVAVPGKIGAGRGSSAQSGPPHVCAAV